MSQNKLDLRILSLVGSASGSPTMPPNPQPSQTTTPSQQTTPAEATTNPAQTATPLEQQFRKLYALRASRNEESNEDTFTVENIRTYLALLPKIERKADLVLNANQAQVSAFKNVLSGAAAGIAEIRQKHKDLEDKGANVPASEIEELKNIIIGFNKIRAVLADREEKGKEYAMFRTLLDGTKFLLELALRTCIARRRMADWLKVERSVKASIARVEFCYEKRKEGVKNGMEGAKEIGAQFGLDLNKVPDEAKRSKGFGLRKMLEMPK